MRPVRMTDAEWADILAAARVAEQTASDFTSDAAVKEARRILKRSKTQE